MNSCIATMDIYTIPSYRKNIINECQAVGDFIEETGFISHMSDLETSLYNTLQDLLVDGSILPEMTMSRIYVFSVWFNVIGSGSWFVNGNPHCYCLPKKILSLLH